MWESYKKSYRSFLLAESIPSYVLCAMEREKSNQNCSKPEFLIGSTESRCLSERNMLLNKALI